MAGTTEGQARRRGHWIVSGVRAVWPSEERRAQSQQIGFILMFAILIGGTTGATVVGVGLLGDIDDQGAFQQAQSELSSVQSQHYELASGVPYRSESMELSSGTLGYGDDITVQYEISTPSTTETESFDTREVTYSANDERLIYVGGAIFREDTDAGTALMRVEPSVGSSDSGEVILPYLNVTRVGGVTEYAPGGEGSSSVYLTSFNYNRETRAFAPTDADGNAQDVTVTTTIQSERWRQWERYFRDSQNYQNVRTEPSNNIVRADTVSEQVIVYQVDIHVQYTQETGV